MSKKLKQHNSHNKAVLKKGLEKATELVKAQMLAIGHKFADLAVVGAVKAWDRDGENLTGNTRTGFCAAVYFDGRIHTPIHTVFDAMEVEAPTSGYTSVGQFGFKDYDTGMYIGHVKDPSVLEYKSDNLKFKDTNIGGSSREDTFYFLMRHRPSQKGMCIVVANVSPYANYLVQMRDMDILVSETEPWKIQEKLNAAVASVGKI